MRSYAALSIIIVLLSLVPALQAEPVEYYILTGYPLTVTIDESNGACIGSAIFNPANASISSSVYLGAGMLVKDIMIDIIPPAVYIGEKPPNNWWPGYSIKQPVDIDTVNETVYTKTIMVSYPVSNHRVSLDKYIIFHKDKPYIDLIYEFVNHESKPVELNLASQWFRPVSFGLTLSSQFGGDPDDDYQVYGIMNGSVVIHKYFSSWGVDKGRPDIANASISFIGLFSGPNDYKDYGEAVILIPSHDTIGKTYSVWFEINGLNVAGVKPSVTIRLEMRSFTIRPKGVEVFRFKLYIGPAVKWLLESIGLGPYLDPLLNQGLVKEAVIDGYGRPPYTVVVKTVPREALNTTVSLYYITADNRQVLIGSKPFAEDKVQFTINRPGKYVLKLNDIEGTTIDRKYEYRVDSVDKKAGNIVEIDIYYSRTIPVYLELTPITWITIKLVDEAGNRLKLLNNTVQIIFSGGKGEFRFNLNKPLYKTRIPAGEYSVEIMPINLFNRTLGDVYVDGTYMIVSRTGDIASFTFKSGEPGTSHTITIKYIPAGSLVSGPPIEMLLLALLAVSAIMIMLLIVYYRRRRYS